MKYGFSTLSCPSWNFREIITSAKDLGYHGVEIRGISEKMYAPKIKYFSDERIEDTMRYLDTLGIEIPMLTTGAEIAVKGKEESALEEAYAYVDLASRLNVPYIRLLCASTAAPSGGDRDIAAKLYIQICQYAQKKRVSPLIETNGIFADTKLLKEFMDSVNCGNKGVLWDIHHPYRFMGESVDQTLSNIGKLIKYVHIKDSVMDKGQVVYKMSGYGDVPIQEAINKLRKSGYNGYLTYEWVKRWNKALEEPGVALCHYINFIKTYIEKPS